MKGKIKNFFLNTGKPKLIYFSIGIVLVFSIAYVVIRLNRHSGERDTIYNVKKGDLKIIITEEGVLKAKESVNIKADIPSESKIVWIEEQGKYVKKGDRLVELDKTELEDYLDALDLDLIKAKANLKTAEEDQRKYIEAEYPQKIKELEFKIEKAEAQLEKAEEQLPSKEEIEEGLKEGIYSKSEIRDAELAVREAKMNLETAKLDLELFKEYTDPKNRLDKETVVNTAKATLKKMEERKKTAEEQLAKMVMVAPCDGLVIYGGPERYRWVRSSSDEEIKVGARVYKGQTIITLPDVSKMQVAIKIHETDIHKIDEDLKAVIRIEAFPDMVLTGKVTSISALAREREGWRSQGVKIFDVDIDVDGEQKDLRPGMTAKVDVFIDEIRKVLCIPLESVFESEDGKTKYCYVKENGKPEKRVIEIGASNNNYVIVTKGLKAGEDIYQYNPLLKSSI